MVEILQTVPEWLRFTVAVVCFANAALCGLAALVFWAADRLLESDDA